MKKKFNPVPTVVVIVIFVLMAFIVVDTIYTSPQWEQSTMKYRAELVEKTTSGAETKVSWVIPITVVRCDKKHGNGICKKCQRRDAFFKKFLLKHFKGKYYSGTITGFADGKSISFTNKKPELAKITIKMGAVK